MTIWTRDMATDLAGETWRNGWLHGRAMSLRLLQHWLDTHPDATTAQVRERVDAMLGGVEADKAKEVGT
jgi:hypothetical protein